MKFLRPYSAGISTFFLGWGLQFSLPSGLGDIAGAVCFALALLFFANHVWEKKWIQKKRVSHSGQMVLVGVCAVAVLGLFIVYRTMPWGIQTVPFDVVNSIPPYVTPTEDVANANMRNLQAVNPTAFNISDMRARVSRVTPGGISEPITELVPLGVISASSMVPIERVTLDGETDMFRVELVTTRGTFVNDLEFKKTDNGHWEFTGVKLTPSPR